MRSQHCPQSLCLAFPERRPESCTTYLLMSQNIAAYIPLFSLDLLDIGLHSVLCKVLRKEVVDVSVAVETGEL